jgi:ferredoxin
MSSEEAAVSKVTLEIDRDRCRGHGVCMSIAPLLIELDNDGIAVPLVSQVPTGLLGLAEQIVSYCPERAITLQSAE